MKRKSTRSERSHGIFRGGRVAHVVAKNRKDADSSSMAPEVTTLNQRKTVDPRFLRIEFGGWFVVATTQRPRVNGLPNDVDGAVNVRPPFHQ